MSRFEYKSIKLTNHVQRFVITTRVYNGLAEFTLRVRLMNNERAQTYSSTYTDVNDLLHDLRNGWYLGLGMQEPAYHEAVRDLSTYVDGLADAGLDVARIDR